MATQSSEPFLERASSFCWATTLVVVIAWFVLGVFHWIGLLYYPALAVYVFGQYMTAGVLTIPTVLVIGTAFMVNGFWLRKYPAAPDDQGIGVCFIIVGAVIIAARFLLPTFGPN